MAFAGQSTDPVGIATASSKTNKAEPANVFALPKTNKSEQQVAFSCFHGPGAEPIAEGSHLKPPLNAGCMQAGTGHSQSYAQANDATVESLRYASLDSEAHLVIALFGKLL